MAFTPQNPKVVLRVLVPILHLYHVTGELRFASAREIPFVVLPRVTPILAPMLSLRPDGAAPSLRDLIHVVCPSPDARRAALNRLVAAKLQRSREMREGGRQPLTGGMLGPAPRMTRALNT